MALSITVLSAPNPDRLKKFQCVALIEMGDDYLAGEPLLADLNSALSAYFGGKPLGVSRCYLSEHEIRSIAGFHFASYNPENDNLEVRINERGAAEWVETIAVAGNEAVFPVGYRTILAVEATTAAFAGHKWIERAVGEGIGPASYWTDELAVTSHVGDLPVGTIGVLAVEGTQGTSAGVKAIGHTAAAAGECNVDIGAGTVTFEAGDDISHMRCLVMVQPHPGACTVDYDSRLVTFDASDAVTECAMLCKRAGGEVTAGVDLTDTNFLVTIFAERD